MAEEFEKDAPIRLGLAAKIAFPDGSMGPSGLRKERDSGRLETEIIAGKEYTTLAAIGRMRELCRVSPKAPTSPSASEMVPDAKVRAAIARAALEARLSSLKKLPKRPKS